MEFITDNIGIIIGIIAVIALLGIIASGYVKAPPDTAYIISGLRKKPSSAKPVLRFRFWNVLTN